MSQNTADPTLPWGDAVNSDGTLKDAADMDWDYDPDNSRSSGGPPAVPVHQPASLKWTQGYIPPAPLPDQNPPRKRRGTESTNETAPPAKKSSTSQASTRKGAAATEKAKPATKKAKPKPKETAAINRINLNVDIPSMSSGESPLASAATSDTGSDLKSAKTDDVYFKVFTKISDNESRCNICTEIKSQNATKHSKLQTTFKGNVSTLRSHISRSGDSHYKPYVSGCIANGRMVHERAVPPAELERKQTAGLTLGGSQSTLDGFATVSPAIPQWTQDGMEEGILRFVTECDQAISVVDHPAFRNLITYQNGKSDLKDSDIPHRTTVTSQVKERASEIEAELSKLLQAAPGRISLTFDGWSSAIMMAYIGVTAHYINDDWELKAELLSFRDLPGSHTGENMAEVLYEVLESARIKHKLMNATADNLSTNDKCLRILGQKLARDGIEFNAKDQRSHCYAHAISLAEEKFLKSLSPTKKVKNAKGQEEDVPIVLPTADKHNNQIEENEDDIRILENELANAAQNLPEGAGEVKSAALLLKIRGLITKVRRSPQAKAFFKKCCKQTENCDELELLPFCKTRWGSWCSVLQRILRVRPAIQRFVNLADDSSEVPDVDKDQPLYASYRLSPDEWELVALIHSVLIEAQKVQEQFSSETEPSVWRIIPVYEVLMRTWRRLANAPHMAPIRDALLAGIEILEKYYNKTDNSSANIVSIFMNPMMKDGFFRGAWNAQGIAQAARVMEKTYDRYEAQMLADQGLLATETPKEPTTAKTDFDGYGGDYLSSIIALGRRDSVETSGRGAIQRSELEQYLREELMQRPASGKANILGWWKINAYRFPILSRIARDYLAIQGSSVPSERVFSDAGLTDDKRRRSLETDTFTALQTVKNYYKRLRREKLAHETALRLVQQANWLADDLAQAALVSGRSSPAVEISQ